MLYKDQILKILEEKLELKDEEIRIFEYLLDKIEGLESEIQRLKYSCSKRD